MQFKINFLLLIGFLTQNIHGQELDSRFIVLLGHFTQPYLNETVIQCAGTLVSEQHIICPADCVIVQSPAQIAVNVRTVTLVPEDGNFSASTLIPAERVFIHPFYDGNQYANNAAIVTTEIFKLNPNLQFTPRSLGSLSTSTSCNLFGWGGELLNPRRDAVMVNSSIDCDPNYPQNFCTTFDSVSHATCTALRGSPLTCGSDTIAAGFVTNDEGCSTNAGRAVLNYHSIRDFRDWIEGVVGPALPEREVANFIVTIMERQATSIPRCFGTIISSRRVLTTATCATVDSSLPVRLEVQTRIVQGSSSTSVNWSASRIFIHPNFNAENPLKNNVAIIEISGNFDSRIVSRNLGNLQQNSSCQLFGWGPTDIRFTRADPITIREPQSCDPNHPQAFCSLHPTIFHYSCYAMSGSPVTCGGNEGIVAGFLINNATCSSNNDVVSLSYHSVSDFNDFILDPSNYRGMAGINKPSLGIFVIFILCSLIM